MYARFGSESRSRMRELGKEGYNSRALGAAYRRRGEGKLGVQQDAHLEQIERMLVRKKRETEI